MKKIILIVVVLAFCGYGISIKFGDNKEINTKEVADYTKEKVKNYIKKEHLDNKDTLKMKKKKIAEKLDTISDFVIEHTMK